MSTASGIAGRASPPVQYGSPSPDFSDALHANSAVRFMKHFKNFYVFMSEETV
jgi:hypothetical protein